MLVGLMGLAQDVETMLTEKIKVLDKSYKTPELQPLANDFERVALAAPTNWLANYYTAYVNIRIADLSQGKCNRYLLQSGRKIFENSRGVERC